MSLFPINFLKYFSE
jgi:hypothetical protein